MFGFCAARPAAVARALIDEPNALQIQSRDHADGWGIGYYPEGDVAPRVLRSINPAYADAEFAEAAGQVSARTVIASRIRWTPRRRAEDAATGPAKKIQT